MKKNGGSNQSTIYAHYVPLIEMNELTNSVFQKANVDKVKTETTTNTNTNTNTNTTPYPDGPVDRWTSYAIKSSVKGPNNRGSTFDDLQWTINNFGERTIPRIIGVEFYWDTFTSKGIRAIYDGKINGPQHKSTDDFFGIESKRIMLKSDEWIIDAGGLSDSQAIDILNIVTNKGRTLTHDGFITGNSKFGLDIPNNGQKVVVAFGGRLGDDLTALYAHYVDLSDVNTALYNSFFGKTTPTEEVVKWTDKTQKSLEKGPNVSSWQAGSTFDDLQWVKNSFDPKVIPRIIAVDFYWDTFTSKGIRAVYEGSKNGPNHKSTDDFFGIQSKRVTLQSDEWIVDVGGLSDSQAIDILNVVTNKGRTLTHDGFITGNDPFSLDIPTNANNAVIAFGGKLGDDLNKIWAHYIDLNEFEWGSSARANYKV